MRLDLYLHDGNASALAEINTIVRALLAQGDYIMSAISEFAARLHAHNDKMDAAVTAIQADIEALNAKIEELQNTAGTITVEDQALLDQIEARGDSIAAKLDALDALTPPVPPPA